VEHGPKGGWNKKKKFRLLNLRNGGRKHTTVPSYTQKEPKGGTTSESRSSNSSGEIRYFSFNSRVHLFGHGKLHSKWEDPYLVPHVVDHDTVTLQCDNGYTFKANGQRLKLFLPNPQNFEEVDVLNFLEIE
jgi:hypothetical protein